MRESREKGAGRKPDAEAVKKSNARALINMRIHRGTLERQPCEECDAPDAEAHHTDYDRPDVVRWLCRQCHGTVHYPEATERDEHQRRFAAIVAKHLAK